MRDKAAVEGFSISGRLRALPRLCLLLAIALLLGFSASAGEARRILVINSYHSGYPWSDQEMQGINAVFSADLTESRVDIEYLDSRNQTNSSRTDDFRLNLEKKYRGIAFNLVIAADNPALNFVLENRTRLFPKIPVVFCGINGFRPEMLGGQTQITGVAEELDIVGTLNAIIRLQQRLKEVAVINDNTTSGQGTRFMAEKAFSLLANRLPPEHYLPNVKFSELLRKVGEVSPDSAVLLLTYGNDGEGTPLDIIESTRQITAASRAPVYAVHSMRLGQGIVGGALLDGRAQGEAAAQIGIRILHGEKASDMPVRQLSASLMFDAKAMHRFGLDTSLLPFGSIVANSLHYLYREYKMVIWVAAALLLALLLAVALLSLNILRRRYAERELREKQRELSVLLGNLPGMAYRCTADDVRKLEFISNGCLELTGYPASAFLNAGGLTLSSITDPVDLDGARVEISAAKRDCRPFRISYRIKTALDGFRWVLEQGVVVGGKRDGPDCLEGFITDITDRLQMEKTLRESEENLAITLNSIGDGVISTDIEGKITRMNPVAEKLTGWNLPEAAGKPITEVFNTVDEATYQPLPSPFNSTMQAGRATAIAAGAVLMSRSGVEYAIADSSTPIRSASGMVLGMVLVFRDQTKERAEKLRQDNERLSQELAERTRMAKSLQASEEKLRVMIDASPLAIFLLDMNLRIVRANPRAIEGFSLTNVERLMGANILDFVSPASRDTARAAAKLIIEKGLVEEIELTSVRSGGKKMPVMVSASLVRNAEGKPDGIVLLVEDITQRKQAGEALRDHAAFQAVLAEIRGISHESEEFEAWKSFLSSAIYHYGLCAAWLGLLEEGVIVPACQVGNAGDLPASLPIDSEGGHHALLAIRTAIRTQRPANFGGIEENRLGEGWQDFCARHSCASALALPFHLDEQMEGGMAFFSSQPEAFPPGRVEQFNLLSMEFSALLAERRRRRQNEDALIRAERLAAVGTLAGGVAHEFNNINVAVLGFAQLALLEEGLSDSVREALDRICKGALRAKSITNNLLAFSGGQRGEREPANLAQVAEESLQLAENSLVSDGVEVVRDFADRTVAAMDPRQIGQVVLNLVQNARHAMIDQPVKRLTLVTGHDSKSTWLSVSDTGCGIPQEKLSRIFAPFYSTKGEHADPGSPQAKVKGTGLGLSVSHTIVTRHDGSLKVQSKQDVGTTFTLTMPLQGVSSLASVAAPVGADRLDSAANAYVLVVDDEADARDLLSIYLKRRGYMVKCASGGAECIALLEAGDAFDAIILDLQMPRVSGRDVLQHMLRKPLANPPAVIVATGNVSEASSTEFSGMGVFDTILKPFDLSDIGKRLAAAISKRS